MMLYVGFQLLIAITTIVTFFGILVKITVTQKKLQTTQKGDIQAGAAIDVPHQWRSQGGGLRGLERPPLRWSGYTVNGSGQQAATA